MNFRLAEKAEADKILELYHSVLDTPCCRWSLEYPVMANIEDDLSRDGLFCLVENDEIIGAISIDKDDDVEALECWDKQLVPSMEVSRLCVRNDYQGKGLASILLENMMAYGANNGYKSIHYLVSKHNPIAQKAYKRLNFNLVGECQMYHDEYYCYEKVL